MILGSICPDGSGIKKNTSMLYFVAIYNSDSNAIRPQQMILERYS